VSLPKFRVIDRDRYLRRPLIRPNEAFEWTNYAAKYQCFSPFAHWKVRLIALFPFIWITHRDFSEGLNWKLLKRYNSGVKVAGGNNLYWFAILIILQWNQAIPRPSYSTIVQPPNQPLFHPPGIKEGISSHFGPYPFLGKLTTIKSCDLTHFLHLSTRFYHNPWEMPGLSYTRVDWVIHLDVSW